MLWDKLVRKHANIRMVLCGHISAGNDDVSYTYRTGDNGNKITEIVVNPQNFDLNYAYTGLVCVLNFFDNGERIELEYYSTFFDSYKKRNSDVIRLDDAPTRDVGSIDIVNVAKECGREVWKIDTPILNAPQLDGVINAYEYSVSRTVKNSSIRSGKLESDLTEYMSYDNEYIYYAFSVKQSTPQDVNFQIMPKTKYKNTAEISSLRLDRPAVARIGYSGSKFVKLNMASWTASDTSIPVWDWDVFMNASYDKTSNITTYEIKLSRQYLKNNNYDDTSFGYTLFIGSAQYCWTNPSFLGITPEWYYNFVSISSPSIKTIEQASVKISADQSALRFKTVVNKESLNEIKSNYQGAEITIGTLIAPADMLGATSLTHDFGEAGVNYLDVVATLDMPFDETEVSNTYAGSITNIKSQNIDRDFVGVGYIKIAFEGREPIYCYSLSKCVSSVSKSLS